MAFNVPALTDTEIHVWQLPWATDAASAPMIHDLLAGYAGPDAPAVARGEHGKPHFPGDAGSLGFSWTHSQDTALFAVGRGTPAFQVGVDVERVRPRARALELASRFFAPGETAWLRSLAGDDVLAGFLSLWTVKEAVLKAHGGGLSYGLHRVEFAPTAAGGLAASAFDGDVGPASAWQIHRLGLGEGLVASVAWRGASRSVRVFTYPL
ncbi:4'-phosphopantetheinyl transferase superfamily protein [Bacillus sp. NP157]|nr:4'-phosphopantetheinyl transferase superfamily protein [Bacillus sp. NP157]